MSAAGSPYAAHDDPTGEFAAAQRDFNLTCTQRNAAGKLFWGPMGKPHNRRYTLPTGSVNDTDWTQVVSWKGSIEKDQLIREIQKKRIERRVNKPPYPPMLHYKEDGSIAPASDVHVKKFEERTVDPRLLKMQEMFLNKHKVYASPLDGVDPTASGSATHPTRSRSAMDILPAAAPWSESWSSITTKEFGVRGRRDMGRHSSEAMGAAACQPLRPQLQDMAYAMGRVHKPKMNDRQRKMWPEHPPQARGKDLGLKFDVTQPRYSFTRGMAHECSNKLRKMSETRPRELIHATQQGWGL